MQTKKKLSPIENLSIYYVLDYACGTNETGPEYPQIQMMRPGYKLNGKNSFYEVAKYQSSLPPFAPDLDYLILHNRSKPTDVLSNSITSSTGLFVSAKFKDILLNHKLTEHRFYPAQIKRLGKSIGEFFWLQMVTDNVHLVNFERSTFDIVENFSNKVRSIKLKSLGEYETGQAQFDAELIYSIQVKTLALNETFDRSIDMFMMSKISTDLYISERLKHSITNVGVTGVLLKRANLVF